MKKLGDYKKRKAEEEAIKEIQTLAPDISIVSSSVSTDKKMIYHFLIGAGVIAIPVAIGCIVTIPSLIIPMLCILWTGSGIWISKKD